MYVQDYDDWLPSMEESGFDYNCCIWAPAYRYLPGMLRAYIPGDTTKASTWTSASGPNRGGMSAAWVCPFLRTPPSFNWYPWWYTYNYFLTSTPGATMAGGAAWFHGSGQRSVPRMGAIRKDHSKLIVVEDIGPNVNAVYQLHSGNTNALFLDGHVETISGATSWWSTTYHAPNLP